MTQKKAEIREKLRRMQLENAALTAALTDEVLLTDYAHLVRGGIWTDALQAALDEHEIVRIPAGLYLIDGTVIIPSDRHIEAEDGAVIRQAEGVRVLLLRNASTADGTHAPIKSDVRDTNISIHGGRWEESWRERKGYGRTGMYDMNRSLFGVSTFMLFNNMDHLTLTDMTFAHTAGFSVQMGDIRNVHCENIEFVKCYADGLHINGNTENLITRNIYGHVGDDLVALNMYDWQNSSVNFGPMKTVLCEGLDLSADSRYKAMRIEPGTYYYADGTAVDCSLTDAIISRVRGIKTFKMYFQTPPYNTVTEQPEKGDVGSGDYIFFEDIDVDLVSPVDNMAEYMNSHPVKGTMAPFEINSNISHISFERINLKLYDAYPMSCLLAVGPKSVRWDAAVEGDAKIEVFDPYLSSTVGEAVISDVTINGEKPEDITPYVREIRFDNLYPDVPSSGKGTIEKLIYRR